MLRVLLILKNISLAKEVKRLQRPEKNMLETVGKQVVFVVINKAFMYPHEPLHKVTLLVIKLTKFQSYVSAIVSKSNPTLSRSGDAVNFSDTCMRQL